MVNNAVAVLISIKHLNISFNKSPVNLLITEKLISRKTVAMNACNDWKLTLRCMGMVLPLANVGLVLCNSKNSLHRHCIEAGIFGYTVGARSIFSLCSYTC